MSRIMKIFLGVIGLLICTCTLLCVAVFIALPQLGQNFVQQAQDPVHVKQVGAQIADYTIPPGYQEAMGMDVFTTQMMILTPVSNRGVSLALMQFKNNKRQPRTDGAADAAGDATAVERNVTSSGR